MGVYFKPEIAAELSSYFLSTLPCVQLLPVWSIRYLGCRSGFADYQSFRLLDGTMSVWPVFSMSLVQIPSGVVQNRTERGGQYDAKNI